MKLSAVHGWLLVLPAAVLLVAFTHYPAVATLVGSFYATPKGSRPAPFAMHPSSRRSRTDPVLNPS